MLATFPSTEDSRKVHSNGCGRCDYQFLKENISLYCSQKTQCTKTAKSGEKTVRASDNKKKTGGKTNEIKTREETERAFGQSKQGIGKCICETKTVKGKTMRKSNQQIAIAPENSKQDDQRNGKRVHKQETEKAFRNPYQKWKTVQTKQRGLDCHNKEKTTRGSKPNSKTERKARSKREGESTKRKKWGRWCTRVLFVREDIFASYAFVLRKEVKEEIKQGGTHAFYGLVFQMSFVKLIQSDQKQYIIERNYQRSLSTQIYYTALCKDT